jgi:hypothetical protein
MKGKPRSITLEGMLALPPPAKRVSRVPSMFSSLEVKVFYPT